MSTTSASTAIPEHVARLLRDRQGLLWVCQRYDLAPGEDPHDYDLAAEDAAPRYRSDPTDADLRLARYYWEAIWLEAPRSQLLSSLRSASRDQPPQARRSVVVLAGPNDSRAQVSSQEFLPVRVLPGLLEDGVPPDNQYGRTRARLRERTAWDLSKAVSNHPGRVLVVVGARKGSDLERLYEVLEDQPIPSLYVLVVWPDETVAAPLPEASQAQVTLFKGDELELAEELERAGAARAEELPRWALVVGNRTLEFSARAIERIQKRFAIITARDLVPPSSFSLDDLLDFLSGSLANWRGYACGLPVPRSYRSSLGLSLAEELLRALRSLGDQTEGQSPTFVLQLPVEGGAGTTTLLRAAAFEAAKNGYPALVLRPEQVEVDIEELVAFATTINEEALAAGIDDAPPIVLIADIDHHRIARIRELPQALSAHGRRAIILRAIPSEEEHGDERRTSRTARLRPLRSQIDEAEVAACERILTDLVERWRLPVKVPAKNEWLAYERATRWVEPTAEDDLGTTFWIMLRFFLTEGMDVSSAERARDALGLWIRRRGQRVSEAQMREVVGYVACLSTFRMVAPLWSVLRPVVAGRFPSELTVALKELEDLVVWADYTEDLDDQVLRFLHPVFAEEYLRQEFGVRTPSERVEMLSPVLAAASPGRIGDVWLAESLASNVLAPEFEQRFYTDWDWRLQAFERLPEPIRDQSKAILHHWARCLYLSADARNTPQLDAPERRHRFESALQALKRATSLPRRPGRDEHPSHLFNTMGTAHYRYATLLESQGLHEDAEAAWKDACAAFEAAIAHSDGSNVEALLAFSQRLVQHSVTSASEGTRSAASTRDVAQALGLLDEAEDLISDHPYPEAHWIDHVAELRAKALTWLSSDSGGRFVRALQESDDPDLGYYCEARLALSDPPSEEEIVRALRILKDAEDRGVGLGFRSTRLRISLLLRHPQTRYNFELLAALHRKLESDPNYVLRPIDLFRHAVLCYQLGAYREGAERFRSLRERGRREGALLVRLRDVLRDPSDPARPRMTQIHVTRILTEWRAEGEVAELGQRVPLRPRHFSPPPREGEIVSCVIRFEVNGPLAVPPRFEERRSDASRRRRTR